MTELDEMIERAKVPAGATPAELRSWANRTARSMAARIEPSIAEALLERASRRQPPATARTPATNASPTELLRRFAAKGCPPTTVRDDRPVITHGDEVWIGPPVRERDR